MLCFCNQITMRIIPRSYFLQTDTHFENTLGASEHLKP